MTALKNLVDETTNIKNELKTCCDNLKNNLVGKGADVSNEDKLSTLVDKVGAINLGSRVAEGSYKAQINMNNDSYTPFKIVTNLDFTPGRIIINIPSIITRISSTTVYEYNFSIDSKNNTSQNPYHRQAVPNSNTTEILIYIDNIDENGFNIVSKFINNSQFTAYLPNGITWTAIE